MTPLMTVSPPPCAVNVPMLVPDPLAFQTLPEMVTVPLVLLLSVRARWSAAPDRALTKDTLYPFGFGLGY